MTQINYEITQHNSTKIFGYFVILYTVCYCLIPYFFSVTIWPDSAQIYSWSQHLQWGYHEHPCFPPFIFKIFTLGFNYSPLSIFFIGALLNVIACWAVWQLGLKFLPKDCALLAALLLPLYLLMSFFLGVVNNNTFNFGLWPLMYLFFYNALTSQRAMYWIVLGITAGLSTLSKYYTAFPLVCMLMFLLFESNARKSFTNKNFYWGIFTFLLVLLPHIIWLYDNNFTSVKYAITRSESTAGITSHFIFPLMFSLEQIGNFSIPFIFILILFATSPRYPRSEICINSFNQYFVHWLAWSPFLLTILLAIIFGWNLASEWGQALPSLWSLSLITLILPKLSTSKLHLWITTIFVSILLLMFSSLLFLHFKSQSQSDMSINFPAEKIAKVVDKTWSAHYSIPLKYLISTDEYLGGVISFYSTQHPRVFSICPECKNDISKKELEQNGAIIVLANGFESDSDLQATSVQLSKQFPKLIFLPASYTKWKRSTKNEVKVWIAILPPNKSGFTQ